MLCTSWTSTDARACCFRVSMFVVVTSFWWGLKEIYWLSELWLGEFTFHMMFVVLLSRRITSSWRCLQSYLGKDALYNLTSWSIVFDQRWFWTYCNNWKGVCSIWYQILFLFSLLKIRLVFSSLRCWQAICAGCVWAW